MSPRNQPPTTDSSTKPLRTPRGFSSNDREMDATPRNPVHPDRIDVSVTWRSSPNGNDLPLFRLRCAVVNQDEQTPKRTTRRAPDRTAEDSKVDSYAWLDIRRDHDLPFVVASFLRMITELADYPPGSGRGRSQATSKLAWLARQSAPTLSS